MGTPRHPLELVDHQGLYFRTPTGPTPWICEINGQWQKVSAPPVAVSNSGRWLADKAIAGQGILLAPRWSLEHYLQRGQLQELFFDPVVHVTQNTDLAVYLLYQKQRYGVPKVKVAVDFIVARVQGNALSDLPEA
jgi:DNA-binding transcriptional LysR family regulator